MAYKPRKPYASKKQYAKKQKMKSKLKSKSNMWNFKLKGTDFLISNGTGLIINGGTGTIASPGTVLFNNLNTYKVSGAQQLPNQDGATPPNPINVGYSGWWLQPSAATKTLNNPSNTSFGVSAAFNFNGVPSYQTLCNNFDRVRLNGIKIVIYNSNNVSYTAGGGATGSAVSVPRLSYRVDFDDAKISVNGLSITDAGHKTVLLNKPVSIFIKPRIVVPVQSTLNATQNNLLMKSQWMDVKQSNGIAFYGLKMWFDDLTCQMGNNFDIKFETTYYVSFKQHLSNVGADGGEVEPDEYEEIIKDDFNN